MGRHVTVTFLDGSVISGGYRSLTAKGEYSFSPGDRVKVFPVNTRKKKHRDRIGILTERISKNGNVYINFDDGGYGAVDVVDLIPCLDVDSTELQ